MRLTGATPDEIYVEIAELLTAGPQSGHPWFLGCQFHPEFKSKPFQPHPLFRAFVGAAYRNRTARSAGEKARAVPARS